MGYILEYFDMTLQEKIITDIPAITQQQANTEVIKILGDKDYIDPNLYEDLFGGVDEVSND